MAVIPVDEKHLLGDKRYLPLGDPAIIYDKKKWLQNIRARLSRQYADKIDGFWGTLGRSDNSFVDWYGEVICSTDGSNSGSTGKVVSALRGSNVSENAKFSEYLLDLRKVIFGSESASRALRLTIQHGPKEGSVVYLQPIKADGTPDPDTPVEFLVPLKGNDKDRHTYVFVVPKVGDVDFKNRFLVYAITFPYKNVDPLAYLRTVDTQYELVRWDGNAFMRIQNAAQEIDRSKKTLVLFHGTFVNCNVSYRGLMPEWLNAIKQAGFEQIIGFNHPSVVDDPQTNAQRFKEMMQLVPGSAPFAHPVSVITTSRGGLVGKCVINDATLNSPGGLMPVERVATVACANGSRWLSFAGDKRRGLAMLLRALKQGLETIDFIRLAPIYAAIPFVGVDTFLGMPGMLAMTPGDARLKAITDDQPKNPRTRYYPIVGDYEIPRGGLINGFLLTVTDEFLIDNVLTKHNDMVIAAEDQVVMPAGFYAYGKTAADYFAMRVASNHLGYFTLVPEPKQRIRDYFLDASEDWAK